MPSPTTVIAVITKAMLHIGAIASGETPNANEAADGLDAFNDVLETWSLQSLAVYSSDVDTFAMVGGQASYTLGPTGNWVTARPVQSVNGAYATLTGVDYPIDIWTLAEYNAVPVKASQSSIIERLAYINDYPLGIVKLYPTPYAAGTIKLDIARVLTAAATIDDAITLPPGYMRALAYAVAVDLTPQYGGGIDVSPQAIKTLAYIKRANRVSPRASFDMALTGSIHVAARGY